MDIAHGSSRGLTRIVAYFRSGTPIRLSDRSKRERVLPCFIRIRSTLARKYTGSGLGICQAARQGPAKCQPSREPVKELHELEPTRIELQGTFMNRAIAVSA